MKLVTDGTCCYIFYESAIGLYLERVGLIPKEINSNSVISENIYNITPKEFETISLESIGLEYERFLDYFYIVKRIGEDHRQIAIDALFECIADRYDHLIDTRRNIENIRALKGYLTDLHGTLNGALIVDYGCGTGLSKKVFDDKKFKLIGIDRCSKMRYLASIRGLKTLSPDQLREFQSGSIDCGFFSYILHFFPSFDDLELLWSRVKLGGALVGNFHKDNGINEYSEFFSKLGADTLLLGSQLELKCHGPYVAFIKQT